MATKNSIQKSFGTYEKILKRSWRTVRNHSELLLIGALAGFAYSGSVLQNVLQQLIRVRPADQITIQGIEESIPGIPYLLAYGRTLIALPSERIFILVLAAFILLAACIFLTMTAQHVLLYSLHRASRRRKHIPIRALIQEAKHTHIWRLFAVNAFMMIVNILIVGGSSIPLSLLLREEFFSDLFIYLGLYIIILPLLFAVNLLGMFTFIHVVRLDQGVEKGFMRAVRVLKKNWLVAVEQTCIILGVNILALIIFSIAIAILSLLTAPFFFLATSIGSITLMSLVGFTAVLIAAAGGITYFGALTAFNYAVWMELAEYLERFAFMPAVEGFFRKMK